MASKPRILSNLGGSLNSNNQIVSTSLTDTGVTAGTYGSASLLPILAIDAKGRVTSASTTSVAGVSSFGYNTSTGVLTISTADGGSYPATITLAPFTTTNLAEGTNQYFTTARARASISASGSLAYNSTTGALTYTQGNTDTVSEGVTNLYFTNARARSAVSASTGLSYTSSTGVFTIDSTVATLTGTQTLTNKSISGATNTLSAIPNSALSNSSVTVGTTAISLGSSSTTLAGLTSVTSTSFVGALTGNASTATALATARTISLTGDVTYTSASFDGSTNVTGTATLANSGVTAGTYNSTATAVTPITVDAKGRITSTGTAVTITPAWSSITSTPTTISGYGITDAYTKTQVDAFLQGLDPKASVIAATTANITLSATQTIDGIALSVGDRVLVKNQTTASQNGIYIVASGAWTRATDMDAWSEVPGSYVFVEKGTLYTDTGWVSTADAGGTIDTTSITWVQFAGAGSYTGTAPITVTGTAISLATTGTAGTYTKVTTDSYGRVTSGTTLSSADLPTYTGTITSSQVTTALGFTPYNSTNPSGYLTGTKVDSITATTPIVASASTGAVTLSHASSGVTAGTYNNVTVNATGHVTSGSNTSYLTANQNITLSGDVSGSGTTAITTTLANSGVTAGTYNNVTVNAKGLVTSASNVSYLTSYTETDTLATVTARGASTSTAISMSGSSAINTTTPGTGTYGLNFTGQATADYAQAITWGWSSSGAQAGIYVQSSGSYGTKMYIATTDSFATGSKTAISIDHLGVANFVRARPQYNGSNLALVSDIPSLSGYLTSESDTLATVTARGASTSTAVTLNNYLYVYQNSDVWHTVIGASSTGKQVRIGGNTTYGGVIGSYADNTNSSPNNLSIQRDGGTVSIGTNNSSYRLTVSGTSYSTSDSRAPIFYDSDNTGYYVNPNGSSYLSSLTTDNGIYASNGWWTFADDSRNPGDSNHLPNSNTRAVRFTFAAAGYTGTGGNYSGVMQFNPWTGTTSSTGDASYQLAFGSTSTNLNGNPQLVIRNGIDSSWGTWRYIPMYGLNQYASTFYATAYYDADNTGYYLDPANTTTSLQIAGAIKQGNNLARPLARWDQSGSSTGMVIFKLPGNTGNYGMVHMVFDIYEYSGNNVATVIIGGHNWGGSTWYNYGAQVIGITDKQVRLGIKDGQYCVVFGTSGSSWSYGQVVLRKIQTGQYYDNIMDLGGTYTISQTTTESFTWVSGDLRQLTSAATIYSSADVRAPIFYDSNDTGYYVNPNSSSNISSLNIAGSGTSLALNGAGSNIAFKDADNSWTGYVGFSGNTGQLNFSGRNLTITSGYNSTISIENGASGYNSGQVLIPWGKLEVQNGSTRSPIFYDYNDTAYYADINSGSNLKYLVVSGDWGSSPYGSGHETFTIRSTYASFVQRQTNGNQGYWLHHIPTDGSYMLYGGRGNPDGSSWDWSLRAYPNQDGNRVEIRTDLRAPIFYDYNDTNYYADPNSRSVFSQIGAGGASPDVQLSVNGTAHIGGTSTLYMGGTAGSYNSWGSRDYTSGSSRYFNANYFEFNNYGYGSTWNLYLTGSYITHTSSVRGPIFYDSDNTGYYVDPNSTSNLNVLQANYITAAAASISSGYGGFTGTPSNGYLITTNIDYSTFNMPTVIIEGYAYGNGQTIHLEIVWYSYNNGFVNYSYTNLGTWDPGTVRIGTDGNGKVCIHLSNNIYYGRMNVRGVYDQGASRLLGWSVQQDVSYSGLSRVTTLGRTQIRSGINTGDACYMPIMYDNDNSGYYVDPASTSNINTLAVVQINNLRAQTNVWHQSSDGRSRFYFSPNANTYFGTGSYYVWRNSSDSGIMTIDSNGYLRVNTSGDNFASYPLHVNGTGYATGDFRAPIFYDSDNTGYYVDPNSTSNVYNLQASNYVRASGYLQSSGNVYIDGNYGYGVVGTYSSYRYQGVFAMGDSYKLPADGTTTGNLYGLAWSHPNAGGVAGNLNTHGLLAMENGNWLASLTGSTRARDDMRAPIFYDNNDTSYYINPNGTSQLAYVLANDWFRAQGNTGFYLQDYGRHLYKVQDTYGSWDILGYQNSYAGIRLQDSNRTTWMHDTGGNGGFYNYSYWIQYWSVGNACLGIGTSSTSSSYRMYVDGGIYATGNITAYSDIRKKTNIITVDNALDKVSKLRGVYYNRIDSYDEKYDTEKRQIGVIAQEVNLVLPEVVTYAKDVDEYGVQYGNMAGLFIEAIKEMKTKIEALEQEIKILKGEV